MNNSLPLSVTAPALYPQTAPRRASAPTRFARILQAVAAFFVSKDDPAALHYIANKYNGEGD